MISDDENMEESAKLNKMSKKSIIANLKSGNSSLLKRNPRKTAEEKNQSGSNNNINMENSDRGNENL